MHARNIHTCYVWRIDGRPADILRSVGVCVVAVSTSHALKLRLAFTVSFVDATALGASPGCIARIDQTNRDTSPFGLVQDKFLELSKRPAVQTAAQLLSSPCPAAAAFQIFHGDPAFGAFGRPTIFFEIWWFTSAVNLRSFLRRRLINRFADFVPFF
jgi:hypothetical protein